MRALQALVDQLENKIVSKAAYEDLCMGYRYNPSMSCRVEMCAEQR